MPKREDIKSILIIGSGPIVIGQACEFDYSGTQATKTLKELGYRVVLINSNPATIMTDPEFADKTYIEPITEEVVEKIIKQEKIDAVLPTMGGQTALNVAISMYDKGMLDGIEFLGVRPEAIKKGEDRHLFAEAMKKIGMDLPKSANAYNLEEAIKIAKELGFPLISRASFTLAGGGSGVAYNMEEFKTLAEAGLNASPIGEIEIMESLLGWKEYEMEVIRDKNNNCIIVCSIENLDPMGVHTGDSITIAPALTLTEKEYQHMRDASFAILREIGVDTGGSNVQFAINPENGRMIVIEMNPRVSRSSALASKATGYPIAKVATLLAVGFTLDEIKNDMTGTVAAFEPAVDYVVTKVPRFTFEKFPKADSTLTTSMKSVGEVMAMGRTFNESIQKALCSLETGICGFDEISGDLELIKKEIRRGNENRLRYLMQGIRLGLSNEEIFELSKIDPWYLSQFRTLYNMENEIKSSNKALLKDEKKLREVKAAGFSDKMISKLINVSENEIYEARKALGVVLEYNEVDTCAGEFDALNSYLYSTTNITKIAQKPREKTKQRVLILGGGPNRIGQGIEFDYCCVHASFALSEMGVETIMYNCNPETVSTDYDTSDVLYFEPIDFERVRSVIDREDPDGIIVHFGGQTPLKLAKSLDEIGAKIIGTTAEVIELAEDRKLFSAFVDKLGLLQPENGTAVNKDEAIAIANKIGYPVLVRPSFVLGGRAMRIVYNDEELSQYMDEAVSVSNDSPVLIDKFLDRAIELDVDCISDGKDVYIGGIMQHIEEAGIHSGDSACSLPPVSLPSYLVEEIELKTKEIAIGLGVIGLMNVQYAIHKGKIYLIEVNPRASRTVPFVSKATGMPLAKVATRVMFNQSLKDALKVYDKNIVMEENGVLKPKLKSHIAIKEAVFPFNKLTGADLLLGPEMKSTGEVMGISHNFGISFAKSQSAAKNFLPVKGGKVFISLADLDKEFAPELARGLIEEGFSVVATGGTYRSLIEQGIECEMVLKVSEGRPNITDHLTNGEIVMAINTSDNQALTKNDGIEIRRTVLRMNVPYFTTVAGAKASVEAIKALRNKEGISIKSIQEFLSE
ncbi:MAG: carbamoyl-phosphate synthase large subunit [Arcobacteraceae bacterium]|jgi:carbamoyl-phosphate synthase large subunit|nr:carbamoyl-phosphate synthase large subunit [Arcobacteraceae bacterium]